MTGESRDELAERLGRALEPFAGRYTGGELAEVVISEVRQVAEDAVEERVSAERERTRRDVSHVRGVCESWRRCAYALSGLTVGAFLVGVGGWVLWPGVVVSVGAVVSLSPAVWRLRPSQRRRH